MEVVVEVGVEVVEAPLEVAAVAQSAAAGVVEVVVGRTGIARKRGSPCLAR